MGTKLLPLAAVGLLTVSCTGSSAGDDGPSHGLSTPAPSAGTPSGSTSGKAGTALLPKVRKLGTLPVIVRLSVPWTPQASLQDEAARQRQQRAIADAQTTLLAELAPYRVRNPRRYASLPLLAATVDEAALTHLLGSRAVASIQEDSARPFG